MTQVDRKQLIYRKLTETLSPTKLDVIDESDQHIGHAQAGGAGHFRVVIQSAELAELPRVKAHQKIYQALADLMGSEIHALAIELLPVTDD